MLQPTALYDSDPIDLAAGLAHEHKHVHGTPAHLLVLSTPQTGKAFAVRLARRCASRSRGGGPDTIARVVDAQNLCSALREQRVSGGAETAA